MEPLSTDKKDPLRFNYKTALFILIFAIYAVNFMGVGDYAPLILVPYALFLLVTFNTSRLFMLSTMTLTVFCLIFGFMSFHYGFGTITSIVGKIIYPITFLLLGYKIAGDRLNYKHIKNLLMVFIVFLPAYGFLSVLKTAYAYGGMGNAINALGGRLTIDLWGENLISATVINGFLSFGLALLPILFLSVRRREISFSTKMVLLFIFFFSTYATIQISSRTGILIILTSPLMVILFGDKSTIRKVKRALSLLSLGLLAIIVYSLNLFNLQFNIETSSIYLRLVTTELKNDSRINTWGIALKGIFQNPLGGRETEIGLSYAHNFWLDVGYDAGILPFILIMLFTLLAFVGVVKFISKDHPIFIKVLVLSMLTAFLFIFMFEPVMQGFGVYFTIFCFFVGVIHKLNFLYSEGLAKGKLDQQVFKFKKRKRKKYRITW